VLAAHGGSPGLRDSALLESAVAAPQATEGCNVCHQQNAAEDWVFTQFYPVLRAVKPGK